MEKQRKIKVGHIFYKSKQLIRLTQEDVDYIYEYENWYEIYQPLQLTHSIFKNLGFTLTTHPIDKSKYFKIGRIILRWSSFRKSYFFSTCKTKPTIAYIHRLQDILLNHRYMINLNLDLNSIDPLKIKPFKNDHINTMVQILDLFFDTFQKDKT